MKVLFVSSGNAKDGISPIVKNQGESLKSNGIELDYFTINGKGLKSYFRHIFILKKHLKNHHYDIIHAHYSLSGYVASLAGGRPLMVSLMGSDVQSNFLYKIVIRLFSFLFRWSEIIVKSEEMKNKIRLKNTNVIPNGVNMEIFRPIEKEICLNKLSWDSRKTHILFTSNPQRAEKNYNLAKEAINILNNQNIELNTLEDIDNKEIPAYLNAADIIILTSLWEGSPNIIKESMACNRPIVSTDVGDVKWLFGNEPGHFISSFSASDFANKIELALEYSRKYQQTNGCNRIKELNIDSNTISIKIIKLYKKHKSRNENN